MNTQTLLLSVIVGLGACNKAEPTPPPTPIPQQEEQETITYTVSELVHEFKVKTWTNHESWNSSPVQTQTSTATTVRPDTAIAKSCLGKVIATKTIETRAAGEDFVSLVHNCIDDTGFSHFAGEYPGQESKKLYPHKYELLTSMRLGTAWTGQHSEDESRSCMVIESQRCDDGIATICVTEKAKYLTWLRQHYCRNDGWRGYETVLIRNDVEVLRTWSSNLVIDGVKKESPEPTDFPDLKGLRQDIERIKANLAQ